MKRGFTRFVMLLLAALVLTAGSQETPHFLEPIDPTGFSEKDIIQLLLSAQPSPHSARVDVGSEILWVYWSNMYGHHLLKLRKDRLYQRDLPPKRDPFNGPDVPHEEVFQLTLSKAEDPDQFTSMKKHKGLDVKTMQTSVPGEVAERLIALWDALTRTLQYPASSSRGGRHRYDTYHFIAGFNGPPDKSSESRMGGVWAPKDGPLFEFANISMKLHQLFLKPEPIDPFDVDSPKAWTTESLHKEIIASCKLLEEKLSKR